MDVRSSMTGSPLSVLRRNELCAVPKNECKCRGYKAHGHANTRAKSIGQDNGKSMPKLSPIGNSARPAKQVVTLRSRAVDLPRSTMRCSIDGVIRRPTAAAIAQNAPV